MGDVQPTELQRRALEKLVEIGRTKKRVIKGRVLVEAGYSPQTAVVPDKVFKSKGFLQLAEELGLTESFLTKALVQDIKKKPGRRKAELELGFKVRGLLDEERRGATYNQFNFFDAEQLKRIARRIQDGGAPSETPPDRLSDRDQSKV